MVMALSLMRMKDTWWNGRPRIVYGFGGNVSYKNWDLNFFFQGTGDTYRVIGGTTYFIPGSGPNITREYLL